MVNRHIIGQQQILLQVDDRNEAPALQHALSETYWKKVVPAFDALFSRLVGPDQLVILDQLEVDLGSLTKEELLTDAFMEKLIVALEKAIKEQLQDLPPEERKKSIHWGRFERWLYFLERGHLPVASSIPEERDAWHLHVFETLAVAQPAVHQLARLIHRKRPALERLVLQHDDEFLAQLIGVITGQRQVQLGELIARIAETISSFLVELAQRLAQARENREVLQEAPAKHYRMELSAGWPVLAQDPAMLEAVTGWVVAHEQQVATRSAVYWRQVFQNALWMTLIENVLIGKEKAGPASLIRSALQQPQLPHRVLLVLYDKLDSSPDEMLAQTTVQAREAALAKPLPNERVPSKQEDALRDANLDSESDAYFLQYAGMILLHPFFARLFHTLELTKDGVFVDVTRRQRALLLLHFVASGALQAPEYHLILPKFLCGIPLYVPTDFSIVLSDQEREEAEHMMQAAINHWEALGRSSPQALREGFLAREGKLSRRENGWVLQVASSPLDVLLDRLPWNLSLVKLPWMKDFLKVEWR